MSPSVPMLRRVSVGVIDQLLSSGSNFLAMVVAARQLTVDEFGAFSLAMVTYIFAVGVVRGLCAEAALVRPGTSDEERSRHGRLSAGSAVALGVAAAPILVIPGLFGSDVLRTSLIVLAVALPVLLLQDNLRHVAFGRGRPGLALLSDALWVAGQLIGFASLAWIDDPSPALILVLWSAPALVAAVALNVVLSVAPTIDARLRWVRQNRDLSFRYLADFVSGQGAGQVAVYAVALVAGVGAVAGIRGAQTLFGAVVILHSGANAVLVPEGRRVAESTPQTLRKMALVAGVAFVVVGIVATGAFLVLPDSIGTMVLGDTWYQAGDLIVPVGLSATVSGLLVGAAIGLRAMSAAAEILRVRIFTTPAIVVCPIIGAALAEGEGAAWGILAGVAWNTIFYWRAFGEAHARLMDEHHAERQGDPDVTRGPEAAAVESARPTGLTGGTEGPGSSAGPSTPARPGTPALDVAVADLDPGMNR